MFNEFYQSLGIPIWLLLIVTIWTLIWKGLALWKSARLNSPVWFVAILIINTLGILEILYIFLFSEMKFNQQKKKSSDKGKPSKNKRR